MDNSMTFEHATSYVAGLATVSPFWLPVIHATSDAASILLPILGVIWLIVQMAFKALDRWRPKR